MVVLARRACNVHCHAACVEQREHSAFSKLSASITLAILCFVNFRSRCHSGPGRRQAAAAKAVGPVAEPGLSCKRVQLASWPPPCSRHHSKRIDHPTSGSNAARARRCTQSSLGPHGRPAEQREDAGHAVSQRDGRDVTAKRLQIPRRSKSVLERHRSKSGRRLVQRRRVARRTTNSAPVPATNSAIRRGHGARGVCSRRGRRARARL